MRLLWCAVMLLVPVAARAGGLPRDVSYNDLVKYLTDGATDARAEACKRLGERRSPDAVPSLGQVVAKDPVGKVREQCLKAIKEIGGTTGLAFVRTAALKDEDPKLRADAIGMLEDLDPKDGGVTAAQCLASESNADVKKHALWAVERRQWTVAQPAVLKILQGDPNVDLRKAALKAMVALGTDNGLRAVYDVMLKDDNVDLRREASEAVEHHPQKGALQPLCKALADKEKRVVSNAIKALAELGLKEGAPCLREAAKGVSDNRLAGDMNKAAARLER